MHWRIFCTVWVLGATFLLTQAQADESSSSEKLGTDRVEFTASRAVGHPGMEVHFTNTSRIKGQVAYLWEFGDGATSTDLHPAHRYEKSGSYSVTLHSATEKAVSKRVQPALIQVKNPVFLADFESKASLLVGWHEWEGPIWDKEAAILGEGGIRIEIAPLTNSLVKMQNPNQTATTGGGGCSQCLQAPGVSGGSFDAPSGIAPSLSPTLADGKFSYAWYFDLSDLRLGEDDYFVMFKLRTGDIDGEEVAGVQIRYSDGRYQISYRAQQESGMVETPWKTLGSVGAYYIRLNWSAANPSLGTMGALKVDLSPLSALSLAQVVGTTMLNLDNTFLTSDYASLGVMDGRVMSPKPGALKLDHFGIYQEPSTASSF